jgi:rare lipoprotein A
LTGIRILAVAAVLLVLAGCGHKKHARGTPPPPRGRNPAVMPLGYMETGLASWYGHPYHGRPAANGEVYDMEKMTAAHRTMPFNTWVRVYDLDTGKSAEVRITDRGPFVGDRIIDLSHAAARQIDMIGPGTARVRIEVIRAPVGTPVAAYAVQVGAFEDRANAERLRTELQGSFGPVRLVERAGNPRIWRVLAGQEPTEEAATELAGRIRQNSGERIPCFVVRLDSYGPAGEDRP